MSSFKGVMDNKKDLYLKEEKIGSGSQGVVYRGIIKETNKPIAIKEIQNAANWQNCN